MLEAFLKLREGEKPFVQMAANTKSKKVRDFGFKKGSEQHTLVLVEISSGLNSGLLVTSMPNVASQEYTRTSVELTKWFIAQLCPEQVDNILTDDVLSNEGFMNVAQNAAIVYNSFNDLYCKYVSQRSRKRVTKLKRSLEHVSKIEAEVRKLLLKASKIRLATSLGTAMLAEFSLAKNNLLTKAMDKCLF